MSFEESGLTRAQWNAAVASGDVELRHRNVVRLYGARSTMEMRIEAAVLAAGPDALASHRSAASLWGVERPARGSDRHHLAAAFTTGSIVRRRGPSPSRHCSNSVRSGDLASRRPIRCARWSISVRSMPRGGCCPREVRGRRIRHASSSASSPDTSFPTWSARRRGAPRGAGPMVARRQARRQRPRSGDGRDPPDLRPTQGRVPCHRRAATRSTSGSSAAP